MIVSAGCGQARAYTIPTKSFVWRLWKVFNNKIDAERQHNDLVSSGNDQMDKLYRLNPVLDIDEVRLNDITSIPALQEAIASSLKLDVAFLGYVQQTSRVLIASLFYLQLRYQSRGSAGGVILSRLSPSQLRDFTDKYPCSSFIIAGKPYIFKIPRSIMLPSKRPEKSFEVELHIEDWSQPINGSPFTIEALKHAQRDYLPVVRHSTKISNGSSRKRKRE